MFRKTLVLVVLLIGIWIAVPSASAYVELVLAPSGYSPSFDENGNLSNPPEITVTPSDQFILELSVWTNESDLTHTGFDIYIYFDPDLVKVKDCSRRILDYADEPVSPRDADIHGYLLSWTNEGDNVAGEVEYSDRTGFTPDPVPYGKGLVGTLEFHCEGTGAVEIYPGTDSELMSGGMPSGNLLTGYHGTLVHQVPEPATLLLLGGGLFLSGLIYRKRK